MPAAPEGRPDDVRLVPMTRAQRDRLTGIVRLGGLPKTAGIAGEIMAAWDAAPTSDTLAAWISACFANEASTRDDVRIAVLAALGVPTTTPEES